MLVCTLNAHNLQTPMMSPQQALVTGSTQVHGWLVQGMGARMRRDNLRRTWVPMGKDLRRLEEERGIVIRFVIGYRYTSACINVEIS